MIRVIRSFLCGLCFFVFGIGCMLIGGIIFPIMLLTNNKKNRRRRLTRVIHISWRMFVGMMCVLQLIKIKCNDKEKLKSLRGKIVVANHPSLIDVVILVSKIPHSVCVVKRGLFKNFFTRIVIQNVYLPNDMETEEFMKTANDILNDGYNIIIFPEGTRTIANRPIRMHRGFAYLHAKYGHPIQPIVIKNNPPILGKGKPWYDIGNRTSVYDLNLCPEFRYQSSNTGSIRHDAVEIAKRIQSELFGL